MPDILPNASLPSSSPDTLLVVCLCAAWCNVCEQYRSTFQQVQANMQADDPRTRFVWLDIEDEADLMEPLDVENFPTVLLAMGDTPRFFGPITPQPQTLERLVRMAQQNPASVATSDPDIVALTGRVQAWSRTLTNLAS